MRRGIEMLWYSFGASEEYYFANLYVVNECTN